MTGHHKAIQNEDTPMTDSAFRKAVPYIVWATGPVPIWAQGRSSNKDIGISVV